MVADIEKLSLTELKAYYDKLVTTESPLVGLSNELRDKNIIDCAREVRAAHRHLQRAYTWIGKELIRRMSQTPPTKGW